MLTINRYKWANIKTRKLVYNPPIQTPIQRKLPQPGQKPGQKS
jgi:ubiquinol-cytochrome c reductase cytochrome c1 subunit